MTSEWIGTSLINGPDPYSNWALGPGQSTASEKAGHQQLFATLLQLADDVTIEQMVERFNDYQLAGDDHPPVVRVSGLYYKPPGFITAPRYITAVVTKPFFSLLATEVDLSRLVSRAMLGQPISPAQLCTNPGSGIAPAPRDPLPATTVVGIIDDGLAIAHERFRRADGTSRIDYAWIQDGECAAGQSSVDYGREYRKTDIDALLAQSTHAGVLDEDAFYRRAGLADFGRPGHKSVARRTAHGTHVMDGAAGYDPTDSEGLRRPIVCVQLPATTTEDTSGARLDPYVQHAIYYILNRAELIAQAQGVDPLPVVINFSYGTLAGPHDGTSELEAGIDEIVSAHNSSTRPVSVVLPAGNSHLSRCHAQVAFEAKGPPDSQASQVDLNWRVLPDDQTSSFLEIWLPRDDSTVADSRIEIKIVPPGGPINPESQWFGESDGNGWDWVRDGETICTAIYAFASDGAPTDRGRFIICIQPTAFLGSRPDLAPSGLWTIRLRNHHLELDQPVDAWIQRDDTPHGYPTRGRQSYFDHECYRRFDNGGREIEEDDPACIIKRGGLISAIATGREPSVIGGFTRKEAQVAPYSAGGPLSGNPHRTGPDALAVSDDSRVHRGILASGTRSGSVVALNGTSVAAPQIARWIAGELGNGNPGDRNGVRQEAQNQPNPPETRGGAGRIERDPVVPSRRYFD